MSLNGNLSDSKGSLPQATQLNTMPKIPTRNAIPDLGKPPISPTKLCNRQVTLIENGKVYKIVKKMFHEI